jgi:hypothetical protein
LILADVLHHYMLAPKPAAQLVGKAILVSP